jgi:multiple sugar transport system ATP-binding protein
MTLGDRIAVLSEGKLQQLGPPQDVYDRPANVFVAGFIGSPPMNLLRATARDGRVVAGELVLPRPGIPDGEVVVGLRPEAMRPAVDGMPSLDFRVDVVEPLGDELIVHGSLAAEVITVGAETMEQALGSTNGTGVEAVACLDPRQRPAEGSTIRLGVDPGEVHVFDAQTGVAIR